MSVIRITKERETPYVMLDKTALKDKRLSFRAKGLHAYLMSKPDDWTIHIDDLAKQSPSDGRDAVAKGLKDLEACGYIRRQRLRDASGRMAGWDTVVYETPWLALVAEEDDQLERDEPKPDLPSSVIPLSVNADENIDISESTPKPDLPSSVIPLSEPPKPDLPKTVLPNSANPPLLNKDTTQITETTLISPATSKSKKPRRERKAQSLCPDDYYPSEKVQQGIRETYPGANIPRLIISMKNWSAGKGEMRRDWDATLRTFADKDWEKRGCPAPQRMDNTPKRYHDGDITTDGTMFSDVAT